MADEVDKERRRAPWFQGPGDPVDPHGWLGLSDDDLLFQIEQLQEGHAWDATLLEVVRSTRHFFIRQEAAKMIGQPHLLMEHSGDRHIGQILVRGMTRSEDAEYLRTLVRESRHIEVKKAAEAQLKLLARSDQGRK